MKQKLLVISGPTGVGKTKLATQIYDNFNCELISADSMQLYKGCDIGTAKLSSTELKLYPHYLIDIKEPNEEYSVAEFTKNANEIIEKIHKKGKLPVIVGGTGLYIEALLFEYNFQSIDKNQELREKYTNIANEKGNYAVYEILKERNPTLAERIHPQNLKRVIRALEIVDSTGNSIEKDFLNKEPLYNHHIIFLTKERQELYNTINQRVDKMMLEGLEKEAKYIYDNFPYSQVAKAIGYKEFFPYFRGDIELNVAIDLVKQHSRNYAKRQITWFKRYKDILFVNPEIDDIMSFLNMHYLEYKKGK